MKNNLPLAIASKCNLCCIAALDVTKQAMRNVGIDDQLQGEIFKVKQTNFW